MLSGKFISHHRFFSFSLRTLVSCEMTFLYSKYIFFNGVLFFVTEIFHLSRAYRIGQRRDVRVYRLISSGTIEEMMYLRQVYKQVSLLRKPNATVIIDLARSNLFRQREGKICNHSQAREIVTVTSAGKDAISANARVLETSVNHRKKKTRIFIFKIF